MVWGKRVSLKVAQLNDDQINVGRVRRFFQRRNPPACRQTLIKNSLRASPLGGLRKKRYPALHLIETSTP